MAIRNSWILNVLVTFSLALCRTWWSTLRIEIVCADPAVDPRMRPRQLILSMWHEDLISGCVSFGKCNLKVLVSQSKDGDYISRTIEGLGFSTIRGSSKRGGAQAVREMIRAVADHCIAITPDGPQGPRQEVKDGVTYLSSRAEAPIIALGCAYSNAHRFRSWDRMAFTWPWSRVVIYLMPALTVPRAADKEGLDEYTRQLQQQMHEAKAQAERLLAEWKRTGKRPSKTLTRDLPGVERQAA